MTGWIKMRVDLRDDPSVFRIAEIIGKDDLYVVGALLCFWGWVDQHSVDGHVDGATSRLIDKVSLTPGLADALCSVGWLVIDKTGATIPKFDRHNGESAKARNLKNARQARWRDGKTVDDKASTSASTRGEEKREEKKKDQELAKRSPTGSVPPPVFTGENAEELNGKTVAALSARWELPEQWGIDAQALGWKATEILFEAEKFRQYWTAGKGAGTTRAVKGWRQSWSNWLGKAAERKQR